MHTQHCLIYKWFYLFPCGYIARLRIQIVLSSLPTPPPSPASPFQTHNTILILTLLSLVCTHPFHLHHTSALSPHPHSNNPPNPLSRSLTHSRASPQWFLKDVVTRMEGVIAPPQFIACALHERLSAHVCAAAIYSERRARETNAQLE